MEKIAISACLLGLHTRYDARSKYRDSIFEKYDDKILIPVCPEQLGGLPTPREKADIFYNDGIKKAITLETNRDVTSNFLRGADESAKICELLGIKKAILKSKSPSCGIDGFTYEKLKKMGIDIIIED